MSPFFDIRTILFSSGFTSLVFAIALYLFARSHQQLKGINCLALALAINVVALTLNSLQGKLAPIFSVVLANAILFSSLVLMYHGLCRFLALYHPVQFRLSLIIAISASLLIGYFSAWQNDLNLRIIVISITFAAQLALISQLFFEGNQRFGRDAQRIAAYVYAASAVFFIARAVITAQHMTLQDYMQAGLLSSLSLFVYQGFVYCMSFAIMWMSNNSLEIDLRKQATLDPLTQLCNRRALQHIVEHNHPNSTLNQLPLSVIVLDIDYFKQLNDNHGHTAGDRILQQVAKILQSSTRDHDTVARFGGEEFIVLLPETPLKNGLIVAEKLRKVISNTGFAVKDNHTPLNLSASFGVSCKVLPDEPWATLFSRADNAMYLAKSQGRNRVVPE